MLNSKAIVLSEVVAVVTLLVMVSVVREDPAPHYRNKTLTISRRPIITTATFH